MVVFRKGDALAAAALLAFVSLAIAIPARAQYMNHLRPGANFTSAYAANADIVLASMQKRSQMNSYVNSIRASQAATAGRAPPGAAASAPAAPRQPLTATDFKPAGARDTADKIAAVLAAAADRAHMVQACRQIQATIEANPAFRRNNLANALTLLVAGSIQVLTGTELQDRQVEGLLLLVNDELIDAGGMKLSAENRTRFYDALVIHTGLMLGIAHNAAASGDRNQAEMARTMAREGLASVGIRL